MARVLLDTSCLVAAVSGWHEDHEATASEIHRRSQRGAAWVVSAHSLAEAYSVLTRLPANKRVSGSETLALLRGNWAGAEIVSLTSPEYWSLLEEASTAGIAGGQLYDALIAACARKARVQLLLTWNLAHFSRFAGPFEVRTPRQH